MARRGLIATLFKISLDFERAERRSQRELQARQYAYQLRQGIQHQLRVDAREKAELDAAVFQNQISLLLSVHRECANAIDWWAVESSSEPQPGWVDTRRSQQLYAELNSLQPTGIERLFGSSGRRQQLEQDLAQALAAEQQEVHRVHAEHMDALEHWRYLVALAQLVVVGDFRAYERVIEDSGCLDELAEYGCRAGYELVTPDVMAVSLTVSGPEVVPDEERGVSASGKATSKRMPATRRMEIYQDYVCGAALRAARELMAVLPVRGVLVHVASSILNPASGHSEMCWILSVYCPREAIASVNFEWVDASDLVGTFLHAMRISRGKGFARIDPIDPSMIPRSIRAM